METYLNEVWDERHWSAALKSDNPSDTYFKIKREIEDAKASDETLEKMTPQEREWYRS